MPTIETLTVDVEANTSKFSKGLKLAAAGLAAFAAGAVVAFKAFEDSEKVAAQTDAVLKSTGHSAGVTADEVHKLAGALMEKTAIDDETIQSGENLLLTFKNIRNEAGKGNDIFTQAATASVDLAAGMAAASGGSINLKTATLQLGKALNDPLAGITALGRAGVQFSEQQKKQITRMTEAGNVLGAQKVILKEVQSQFGGFAAASKTDSAAVATSFGELVETLGGLVARGLTPLLQAALQFVDFVRANWGPAMDALGEWFTKVWGVIGPFAKQVGGLLVDAWHALQEAVAPIIPDLKRLWEAIKPVAKAIGIVIGVALILALKALPFVIKALGFVIRVVVAVTTALLRFWRTVGTVVMAVIRFFQRLWEGARDAFGKVVEFVKGIPDKIRGFFATAATWLFNAGKAILQGLWNGLQSLWDSVWNWFQDKLDALKSLPKTLLGIGSPSKVFRGYGQAVGEGFELGLKDGWPDPFEGTMKIAGSAKHGRGPAGGVTVNVYGSVMSERDLADTIHKALLRSKGRSGALGLA